MSEPYKGRAKKRFGQHFLKDRAILSRIVDTAGVSSDDTVLEVGPGPGYLTEELLRKGAAVVAVEFDRDICAYLKDRFAGETNFELIESDAMRVDFTALFKGMDKGVRLVSNPPYNITGPLVAKIIRERVVFKRVVLMLQKEVATRLTAQPGERATGALTIMLALYYDVRRAFSVSAGSFTPPPDVDSAVVVFDPLPAARVPVSDEAFFREVVKKAFSARRKTLSNALKGFFESKDLAAAFMEAAIDPKRRAETLSLKEFSALVSVLLSRKSLLT